eukprot:scaffold31082_cov61-Phaeocystis_antarctica.AAC.3
MEFLGSGSFTRQALRIAPVGGSGHDVWNWVALGGLPLLLYRRPTHSASLDQGSAVDGIPLRDSGEDRSAPGPP